MKTDRLKLKPIQKSMVRFPSLELCFLCKFVGLKYLYFFVNCAAKDHHVDTCCVFYLVKTIDDFFYYFDGSPLIFYFDSTVL